MLVIDRFVEPPPTIRSVLIICSYVQAILDSTPQSVDSVTVDPDGNWSVASQRSPSADLGPNSDDDEDVIEIQDSRPVRKPDTPSQAGTSSNNTGNSQDITNRSSSKRPISQVIDLTLSDDDDEPPRPAKRHNASQTQSHNGHNGYNGYQRGTLTLPHMGRASDSVNR